MPLGIEGPEKQKHAEDKTEITDAVDDKSLVAGARVVVIGDLMLDRYVWGDAERISQEAPVILLHADKREERLGGASSVATLLRTLGIACDGCAQPIAARISFIAPQAEYTPPVIYSVGSREKLVFLVEAWPDDGIALNPGQPVDVRPE